MVKPALREEELREISCEIAKEVFKDILPEAYDNFDQIKHMAFEPSLERVSLGGGGPPLDWVAKAIEILIIIHTAIEVPRVARSIWEWWINRRPKPPKRRPGQIVVASNPSPPVDKLCDILRDKLEEAKVHDETIGKILQSVRVFLEERRRTITIGHANIDVYDITGPVQVRRKKSRKTK